MTKPPGGGCVAQSPLLSNFFLGAVEDKSLFNYSARIKCYLNAAESYFEISDNKNARVVRGLGRIRYRVTISRSMVQLRIRALMVADLVYS